ncbi:hypothetical protein RJ640_022035 [Escallonia rubra]|uniref:C2H2-type domain-containing protein n=1 Tax=Escallonia rubra TaxID=112253 RepID=A0AA88QN01_9ASTE|nr:hypothetical protein RJ640_022035 [Escallonia rubra]
MERKTSLSSNLKHHSIVGGSYRLPLPMKDNNNNNNNTKVIKESWDIDLGDGDLLGGFSWPPRSYICSFCKREFRSAQALGGHMNVHRRDRARLRQSPPPRDINGQYSPLLNLNLHPKPNPNPNFPPFTSTFPPLASPPLSSLSSPSSASPSGFKKRGKDTGEDLEDMKVEKTLLEVGEFNGFMHGKGEIVKLDLEIGLLSDSKEELDLELRLGYA